MQSMQCRCMTSRLTRLLLLRRQRVPMTPCLYTLPSWPGASIHTRRPCSSSTISKTALPTRHGLGLDLSALRVDAIQPDNAAVRLRGRVETTRGGGKLVFVTLRQPPWHTIQIVCAGKALASQARGLTPESIVEVHGTLHHTRTPVTSTSCSGTEIHATRVDVVSAAATPLPFPLHDTQTKLDTRLNHRTMDLRTRLASCVMRLVPCLEQSFRRALQRRGFVEIHTPKLVAGASEGGSAVFAVNYFDQPACLAQSPQLYKQMAVMGDLVRVYEVGHVYRAEKSLTHRHLTEFVGLDLEMVLEQSYLEVVTVVEQVVCTMVHEVEREAAELLQTALHALRELNYLATTSPAADASNGAAAEDKATRRLVVCTVPAEVIQRYGLSETAPHDSPHNTLCTERGLVQDAYHVRLGPPVQLLPSHPGTCESGGGVLRMRFDDAVRLLRDEAADTTTNTKKESEEGGVVGEETMIDFTLPQERRLGQLVKRRYGVDLYVIDAFPLAARPFYTMPEKRAKGSCDGTAAEPKEREMNEARSCSFDVYLRGEEICSGAQREHRIEALQARAQRAGINPTSIADYLASFRYGAWPHGGAGLGLERIAMFLLGAQDIRLCAMFPRDPKRLTP